MDWKESDEGLDRVGDGWMWAGEEVGAEDDSHDPGFSEGVSSSPSDRQRANRGAEGLFRSWSVVVATDCADRLPGCESRLPHLPAVVTLGRSCNSSPPRGK